MNEHGAPEYWAMLALSGVCVLMTLATVCVYALHPNLRKFPANIVLQMSICQAIASIARLLSSLYPNRVVAPGTLCQVQGAGISFGIFHEY